MRSGRRAYADVCESAHKPLLYSLRGMNWAPRVQDTEGGLQAVEAMSGCQGPQWHVRYAVRSWGYAVLLTVL